MKRKKILLGMVALLVVTASLVSSCGGGVSAPPVDEPAIDGETLLEERCSECHGLERVTSAQKTRDEWDATVTRMVNRGAELDDAEKAVLLDYLAATYGS